MGPALISGVFLLLSATVPLVPDGWRHLKRQAQEKRVPVRRLVFRRMGPWFLLAAAFATGMFFLIDSLIAKNPQATITSSLASGSAGAASIEPGTHIQGRAKDVSHDDLFLMLRLGQGAGLRYYPEAQVSDWSGDKWTAGLGNAPPGQYDLMVVAATTPEARGGMRMYMQVCHATASCPGTDTIWDGMETLFSVPVIVPGG